MLTATCTRTVTVTNVDGLHVRPCAAIVRTVSRHQAHVTIQRGTQSVDAASVMDLLSLAATQGAELVLTATGEEAEDALDAVADLLGGATELTGCR
jgi:phosphocarrier protein HPr